MTEEQVIEQPKIASAGKAVKADISSILNPNAQESNQQQGIDAVANEEGKAPENGEIKDADAGGQQPINVENPVVDKVIEEQKPINTNQPLTDEQLKEEYEKRFPKQIEKTPEQIQKEETANEKRMLDVFLSQHNGTLDTFQKLKELRAIDPTELGRIQVAHQLKEEFQYTDEEVSEYLKNSYSQYNLEELEQDEDETQSEFEARKASLQKKKDAGTKLLQKVGETSKQASEVFFNKLQQTIKESDLEAQEEIEYAAKVEEVSKTLPRKLTLELGMLDNKQLDPVQLDVSENDIKEVTDLLKNPIEREKLIFTGDGSLNIEWLATTLLKNKQLEKAARESFFSGQTKQVEIFKQTFPDRTAFALGVGGSSSPNSGQKGKLVSAGKPEVVNSPNNRQKIK